MVGASAIVLVSASSFLDAAQTTNAPVSARSDFGSFKLITERNIFNTRRSARYVTPNRDQNLTRRVNRGDSFARYCSISVQTAARLRS